jgi:hypothetical protein
MSFISLPGGAPFGRLPFGVTHGLVGHPLFTLSRLCALAATLPSDQVEWNAGDVPLALDPSKTPKNGLDPIETIRRIHENRSWLVLKFVERDPEYRDVLASCLREAAKVTDAIEPGMSEPHAFIFVSSPEAVTPYHIDPEQNFLLQLAGEKTIHIWPPGDRRALPEEQLERFLRGGHRNLPPPPVGSVGKAFVLRPGDGVHVPMTAPHWVQNGPAPSVSFSVTFRTRASLARESAVKVNAVLRGLGWRPAPVGEAPVIDGWKARGWGAVRAIARAVK